MTETEWQNSSAPQDMLDFLRTSGRTSKRKHRLFAVACSRRVWSSIAPLGYAAVEMAEKFADGLAGPEELRSARLACRGAGGRAAWYAAATNPENAARNAALSAQAGVAGTGTEAAELLAQAGLLRDIFGPLPFRCIAVDLAVLTPTVVELAQAIYDDRAFDRMPVLAEALQEAGCGHQEILSHCRSDGEHVRGCWAVDLVLGKA